MKRPTRISPNAICLIPRKAIAGLILAMAILTIVSFISIELKRILWLRSFKNGKVSQRTEEPHFVKVNGTAHLFNTDITHFDKARITPKEWNDRQLVENVFSDEPHCISRTFLMILVTSSPENFERRDVIRKTWANTNRKNPWTNGLKTKTVFLVGKSTSKFLNILLKRENEISGDILLGDYTDTYRNLTAKVTHGLTWALSHCRPSYTLKTDDDCFVNTHLLLHFLWRTNPLRSGLYAGRVRWAAPVIRDPNSRWFVSSQDFSAPRFPPYAGGAGYVLSLDVLARFSASAPALRAFPNEDAYVGAVLGMAGIRPTYSARFAVQPGPWQMCNFLYLFVVHRVKPARMAEFQEMAEKAFENCSKAEMANDWV